MTDINLNDMSLAELKKLGKNVEKAIETHQERQRKEALAAAEAKAKEMGFTLAELVSLTGSKKSRSESPPKYRHPENPEITWTGRGRQPEWMKSALAEGRTKDEFLIDS